jgi:hypothetical protein
VPNKISGKLEILGTKKTALLVLVKMFVGMAGLPK